MPSNAHVLNSLCIETSRNNCSIGQVSRCLSAACAVLLGVYADIHGRHVTLMVRRSVAATPWLHHKVCAREYICVCLCVRAHVHMCNNVSLSFACTYLLIKVFNEAVQSLPYVMCS